MSVLQEELRFHLCFVRLKSEKAMVMQELRLDYVNIYLSTFENTICNSFRK